MPQQSEHSVHKAGASLVQKVPGEPLVPSQQLGNDVSLETLVLQSARKSATMAATGPVTQQQGEGQASKGRDVLLSQIPFLSGLLPQSTAHGGGGPAYINQDDQDSSSGEAPYSGDSDIWLVDTETNCKSIQSPIKGSVAPSG